MSIPLHINPGEYDIVHRKNGWYFFLMTPSHKEISGGPYKTAKDAADDLYSIFDEAGASYS